MSALKKNPLGFGVAAIYDRNKIMKIVLELRRLKYGILEIAILKKIL